MAARKHPSRRRRRNTPDLGLVPGHGAGADLPASSGEWLKVTRGRWDAFAASPAAGFVEASDLPALTRLFGHYDELERSLRAFRKERFVEGYNGQPRLNPISKYVTELEGSIRQLEDRFGLTPKARLQLGMEFGTARRSLRELNDEIAGSSDRRPRHVRAIDPAAEEDAG